MSGITPNQPDVRQRRVSFVARQDVLKAYGSDQS